MLVICEDCAKKYNIDETRIRGRRARFTCNECGHIIIVDKEDITRSLLTGKSAGPAPTMDLLREMEAPLVTGSGGATQDPQSQPAAAAAESLVKRKKRGVPVFVTFIMAMLAFLTCVSLVYAYLYTGHLQSTSLADVFSKQPALRTRILLESALIFGVAWAFILAVLSVIARLLHGKFRRLVENANQLSIGDYDVIIDTRGPREIRDLAFALERIKARLKAK